jgi:hypothetical protein
MPRKCWYVLKSRIRPSPILTRSRSCTLKPKKRLLKYGVEVVNVTQPGQPNNGLVEIIDEEAEKRRIAYENMFINGKRYKVPERIIHLDFWNKLGIKHATSDPATQK